MADFLFPSSAELIEIAREKEPVLTRDRAIFDILPTRDVENDILIWEQMDSYGGLQAVRGLNGQPARVRPVGAKRYMAEPGYYGEFMLIDERELTRRRAWGSAIGGPIDISDLVMERQDQLLGRRLDRIETIGWLLITTGTFAVTRDSAIVHTDTFTIQTFTALVPWATLATSTPLADLRAIKLLARGKGVRFGAGAVVWLNTVTISRMLSNTNPADLGGRYTLTQNGGQIRSLEEANRILLGEDLPQIREYDEGYLAEDGTTFNLFIPDAKGVAIGQRPAGQRVGEYRFTRNVNNSDMGAGAYQKVIDNVERTVPREIEVHDGHNGGPVLFYPGSIVAMNL